MDAVGHGYQSLEGNTDMTAANNTGTIFFSAPLYRPNLHYQVQIKPTGLKATIDKMGSWIKENHLYASHLQEWTVIRGAEGQK